VTKLPKAYVFERISHLSGQQISATKRLWRQQVILLTGPCRICIWLYFKVPLNQG